MGWTIVLVLLAAMARADEDADLIQRPRSMKACVSNDRGNDTLERWIGCLEAVREAERLAHLAAQDVNRALNNDDNAVHGSIDNSRPQDVPAQDIIVMGDTPGSENQIASEKPELRYDKQIVSGELAAITTMDIPYDEDLGKANIRFAIWFFLACFVALPLYVWLRKKLSQSTIRPKASYKVSEDVHGRALEISEPLGFALATVFFELLYKDNSHHQYTSKELEDLLGSALDEALSPALGHETQAFRERVTNSFESSYRVMSRVSSTRQKIHQNIERPFTTTFQTTYDSLRENNFRPSTVPKTTKVVEVRRTQEVDKHEEVHDEDKYKEVRDEDKYEEVRDEDKHDEVRDETSEIMPSTSELKSEEVNGSPRDNIDITEELVQRFQQLAVTSSVQERLPSPFGISRKSSGGNLSEVALHTYERSVEAQNTLNFIKYLGLMHKLEKREMKKVELSLAADNNSLLKQKMELNKSRFDFKKWEAQDQALAAGCSELRRRCADDFVAGLIIMLGCMGYSTWKHIPLWFSDLQKICKLEYKEKPRFSLQYMSWIYGFAEDLMRSMLCMLKATAGLSFGIVLSVLLIMFVFRRLLSSPSQAMPTTVFLVCGSVVGFAGKLSVDMLGGDGFKWVMVWGLLCILHAFSNFFTAVVFYLLNRNSKHFLRPSLRMLMFHTCLGIVLPAFAGFVAFPTLFEGSSELVLACVQRINMYLI